MPETLPSAFYRGTRQSNILPSATLGKIKHSAKVALPRHSAKVPLGKRWSARDGGHLPSDFAECLTAGTRQFFFIFKNLFCRVPAPGTRQFFFKTYFAECLLGRHSAKPTLPSAPHGTRQNIFSDFGPKFFSGALWQYFKLYFKIWSNFDFFWYISLVYFVSLIFWDISNLNCRYME